MKNRNKLIIEETIRLCNEGLSFNKAFKLAKEMYEYEK